MADVIKALLKLILSNLISLALLSLRSSSQKLVGRYVVTFAAVSFLVLSPYHYCSIALFYSAMFVVS